MDASQYHNIQLEIYCTISTTIKQWWTMHEQTILPKLYYTKCTLYNMYIELNWNVHKDRKLWSKVSVCNCTIIILKYTFNIQSNYLSKLPSA